MQIHRAAALNSYFADWIICISLYKHLTCTYASFAQVSNKAMQVRSAAKLRGYVADGVVGRDVGGRVRIASPAARPWRPVMPCKFRSS